MTNQKGVTLLELIMVIMIISTLSAIAAPMFSKNNYFMQKNIVKSQLNQVFANAKIAAQTNIDTSVINYSNNTFVITLKNNVNYNEEIDLNSDIEFTSTPSTIEINPKGVIENIADGGYVNCTFKLKNSSQLDVQVSKYLDVNFIEE